MKRSRIPIFLLKKATGSVITIFLVMSILFILLHSVPGGDIATRMAPFAGAEAKAEIREVWGLDKPLHQQYYVFMKKVFTLDYRLADNEEADAMDTVLFFLPYTVLLFGTATILSYVIGTYLGMTLLSEKGRMKKLVSGASIILYALPAFILALYLKTWFVFTYPIFPPVNIRLTDFGGALLVDLQSALLRDTESLGALLLAMILPLIVLVLVGLARPLFLLKDQMAVIAEEPFVMTARAKGLSEPAVRSKHLARCALLPLLNDASINVALIISGGILIEYIFDWPGIGLVLLNALKVLHYPTISAAIFLLTVIMLVSMIIMDMVNAYLDPRVVQ